MGLKKFRLKAGKMTGVSEHNSAEHSPKAEMLHTSIWNGHQGSNLLRGKKII